MEEKIISALKRFGLTDYESRAYYAVCVSGKASATEISRLSKVPRARIYDVLSTLSRKGWIEFLEGRPAQYRIKPYLDVKKRIEREEDNIKVAKETLLEEIEAYSKKDGDVSSEGEEELILGRKKALPMIKGHILKAKSEIMLGYLSTSLLKELEPLLAIPHRKGVRIRIVLNSKQKLPNLRTIKKMAEVGRGLDKQPENGNLLVDKNVCINIFETEADLNAVAIYYTKCIFCINAWLDRIWKESKEI
jgi:sugar-specific transcriptional regulator TrmB